MTSTNNKQNMRYVMAFDVEVSGINTRVNQVLALGVSVVGPDMTLLESLFVPSYIPDCPEIKFEDRCQREFWDRHPGLLDQVRYDGPRTFAEQQKYLIESFLDFRRKWSDKAKSDGMELDLCVDGSFDVECLNSLILQHTTHLPLPYNAYQEYDRVWDVDSELHGFFMGICPGRKAPEWNLQAELWTLYDFPALELTHDHLPHHDAYTIAMSHQALLAVSRPGRCAYRKRIPIKTK